jgi:enoyl-CoA hydratase/carnithine racemase
MDGIEFSIDEGGVATLLVNRPEVRNGLDWAAMDAFAAAVDEAARSSNLRALIVTGGGATFVSGGDLRPWRRTQNAAMGCAFP